MAAQVDLDAIARAFVANTLRGTEALEEGETTEGGSQDCEAAGRRGETGCAEEAPERSEGRGRVRVRKMGWREDQGEEGGVESGGRVLRWLEEEREQLASRQLSGYG